MKEFSFSESCGSGLRILAMLSLLCCMASIAYAQPSPVLVSHPTSTRALAFDAVRMTSEPFSAAPLPFLYNSDNRTRIILFAMNLSLANGENPSAVTADAEDGAHRRYNLVVEYVGAVPGMPWVSQLNVRLDEMMGDAGDILVKISYHGRDSNRVRVGVGHVGGGLSDDPGARPTPALLFELSGRVLFGSTPLSGASVVVSGPQTLTTTTDSNGNYEFQMHAIGNYTVTASKRFHLMTPTNIAFSNLSDNATANFSAVIATSTISGVVKDDQGNGIDDVAVSLKNSSNVTRQAITTGGGTFSFTGVPQGDFYTITPLTTLQFSFDPHNTELLEGDLSRIFNGTRRKYRISGVARDFSNLPNPGVNITLSGFSNQTIVTDANGQYSFNDLPAGRTYQISAAKTDHEIDPGPRTYNLLKDEEANFKAVRLFFITGRVADNTGKGIARAVVTLNGPENHFVETPASGDYAFTVRTPGNYVLEPSRWQDFYQFTPANRSFNPLNGHQVTNFTGVLTVPTTTHVLEFDGSPISVDYGIYWPEATSVGHFFWEFWAMPGADTIGRYLISDGYGGAHTVLFGFNHGPRGYAGFGNVFNGSDVVYFSSDDGPAINEWGHYAVGWDGQNIMVYYNGVPVGKTPFAGPRVSLGTGSGSTMALVGGSNHQNFMGRIAQVRAYEENNPRIGAPESAFTPQTVFSQEGQLMSRYFTPDVRVADLSNGYNGAFHDGWPRGMWEFYFNYSCEGCPAPKFVIDPTAPNFGNAANPGQVTIAVGLPPPTPGGALVYDSFTRNNATYILNGKGGLGATEAGSAEVKTWQTNIASGQPQPFGLLSEQAVPLANDKAVAWVSTGAANGDLDIIVERNPGGFQTGLDTGLSFRVVDANNYFFAYTSKDDVNPSGVRKLTVGYFLGGVKTILASNIAMPSTWVKLRVVTKQAGDINIYGNTTLVYSTSSLVNSSATGAGLYNNGPNLGLTNRWDNFTVLAAP